MNNPNELPVIKARDLLTQTTADLLIHLPKRFILVFDDGDGFQTTRKKTYFSSYFWDVLRAYPNTPILGRHHVHSILKETGLLNAGVQLQLSEEIVRDVIETYQLDSPEEREPLNRMLYVVSNNIHNIVAQDAERYVAPIDILDAIELMDHPEIRNAVAIATPHQAAMENIDRAVGFAIKNDPSMRNNALVRAVQSKMVNFQQVCQSVGARQFPTEVDGKIFKVPVMASYVGGLRNLYEYAADSRGAAKALFNAEAPLQDAEYFARRLQLLAMVVERIHNSDCGSTKYLPWIVKPPIFDEKKNVIYAGDLSFMTGKYFLDETGRHLIEITGNNPELYGKTILLRSVIYCKHTNPHEVCKVCFGGLSRNVSRFANLGHLCAATMTQQTSQSVLSTKHLVSSGVGAPIILTITSSKYFNLTQHKNAYIFKQELLEDSVKVVVARDEAIGLIDILNMPNLDDINPIRVSSLTWIDIIVTKRGASHSESVELQQGNRRAVLTVDFIKFIKQNRWTSDEHNNFVFDLKNWDFTQSAFSLPDMEYSYSEHSHEIAKKIESNMKNITDRENPQSPAATLEQLFDLVNSKLSVNLAALEVIVYSSMLPSKNNFSLARNAESPVLGVAKQIIANRSLGAGYAFERHKDLITDPQSMTARNRPSSLFDVFMAPREVVEEYNRR